MVSRVNCGKSLIIVAFKKKKEAFVFIFFVFVFVIPTIYYLLFTNSIISK